MCIRDRLCNISGIINTFSRYGTVTIERKKGLFLFTNAMYAGIAPLPVLLMVNLLLLLRGPLCPTHDLSLIHISEPTRLLSISYAVFCLKKKKIQITIKNETIV
eukprot:TRINITY_DN44008_c0_g1_i1.p1 TRINITY_DN44008_c0_g1~~TRINITY_DN44008_c0_g1_i1.p1  ORF type:complete len:104 (-),score=11.43 TRINITY_DN44008_c0_g1_i1:34-345(-)